MPAIHLPYNWVPRDYQYPLWEYLHKDGPIAYQKRASAVWHRRAGKDYFAVNFCGEQAQLRRGTYWHCLPTYAQGRKIVWNEILRYKQPFPKELIEETYEKDMIVKFKGDANGPGSIYQVVGTDDINRLVGGNPIGVVFSEYSLCDPAAWHYIQPILRENKGWAIFIFTPRGHNHGYTLAKAARKSAETDKRWFFQQLTIEDTRNFDGSPIVTEKDIEEDRADGMPDAIIRQEYYGSWDAPLVGAYYAAEMTEADKERRITNVPYERKLPVDTYWDLGMDDSTSIVFVQEYGLEKRIIDFYENNGEGLAHYAKLLQKRPYVYGKHYAPHDIVVKELGTGKSRLETARSLGIKFRVARKLDLPDGIEAVRNIISRCWFDEIKTRRLVEALSAYQKQWDEDRKVFANKPLHNWASHPADAFRTFAVAEKTDKLFREKNSKKNLDNTGMREYDPIT
jgi:hypothetical protein